MDTALLIALASMLSGGAGVLIAYLTFSKKQKKDTVAEGESRGVMASDIGYIKAGVDDLKRENRETRTDVRELSERVTRCEESSKQAHRRIDEIHAHIESNG